MISIAGGALPIALVLTGGIDGSPPVTLILLVSSALFIGELIGGLMAVSRLRQ